MNDIDKATANVGNRFDLVLIASERVRELSRERREKEDMEEKSPLKRKKHEPLQAKALTDIENGFVGRSYLDRVKSREGSKKRPKFDSI